jgi:hypothetical protein
VRKKTGAAVFYTILCPGISSRAIIEEIERTVTEKAVYIFYILMTGIIFTFFVFKISIAVFHKLKNSIFLNVFVVVNQGVFRYSLPDFSLIDIFIKSTYIKSPVFIHI